MPLFGRGKDKKDTHEEVKQAPTEQQVSMQITGIQFYGGAYCEYLAKSDPAQARKWRAAIELDNIQRLSAKERGELISVMKQKFDALPQSVRNDWMVRQMKV